MTGSWDFDHHLEDAKGLVQAVRFTGRAIDEGNSMLRDAIEALANGLEEHLEALEKAHEEMAKHNRAETAAGKQETSTEPRKGVGTARKTADADLSRTIPAMPNRSGKTG